MLPRRRRDLSRLWLLATLAANVGPATTTTAAADARPARTTLALEGTQARVVIDLMGGAIGEFRFAGSDLNPLNWAAPAPGDVTAHGFGHFLCLDRWGPASAAEAAKGMPYHGEAANVGWTVVEPPTTRGQTLEARLGTRLPRAGLAVRRTVRLAARAAVFTVEEAVTNENPLGRIYNMVQHPTIAPPFLDTTTIVDCNGRRGLAQGDHPPKPTDPWFIWPHAERPDGTSMDLRHLVDNPTPSVASFAIEDDHGWITASTPARRLLIGYIWRTRDYPWVSVWRDVKDGKPSARGLEFGTTGLHQPFPILVQQGRLWERPLFEYLDAGETTVRRYTAFLLAIPADFRGVAAVSVEKDRLIVQEQRPDAPRTFAVAAPGLGLE